METVTIAEPKIPAVPPAKSAHPYLLKLGQVVITPGALAEITIAGQTPFEFLIPHIHGNWGELSSDDKKVNELALANGERVLSAYRTKTDVKIWVITEADRSSTCILLPEEY